ncbi:class I SAM-dependent methyltransferase [Nocardia sp. NPDC057353]|uniref:class I SAM-dependent methyltransferase n=1 Tax=Nocardia sp. NPDC057353 TaxID=3346104 RepID=UPI003644A247
MAGLRTRALGTLAGQLGNPHGVIGAVVAGMLNRGNRPAVAATVAAAGLTPGATVADIGFGGGAGLAMLLDKVGSSGIVHGIEISPDMIARARKRFAPQVRSGTLQVAEGSLTALPLRDGVLDAAITVNTVYFVDELPAAFAELARTVRPGGVAVVGIGDPEAMAKLPFTAHGFRLRGVDEVAAALELSGFLVQRSTPEGTSIPFHVLAGRRAVG